MTTTTTITRITPADVVAMETKGFWALREDCSTWEELEEGGLELYASSCDSELYAPVDCLMQVAVKDSRLSGGWGVSTGTGLASMRPHYVIEIGGTDVYLAPAYPGAYESLHRTPCYA